MLKKLLSKIFGPLIRREILKIMEKFIQPLFDFLFKLADKYGTKFLVALGGIGGSVYLGYADKVDGLYSLVGCVVVAIGYFFARRAQEKDCVCDECEEEPEEGEPK